MCVCACFYKYYMCTHVLRVLVCVRVGSRFDFAGGHACQCVLSLCFVCVCHHDRCVFVSIVTVCTWFACVGVCLSVPASALQVATPAKVCAKSVFVCVSMILFCAYFYMCVCTWFACVCVFVCTSDCPRFCVCASMACLFLVACLSTYVCLSMIYRPSACASPWRACVPIILCVRP